MWEMTRELAGELGLKEEEGGWVPEEGVEVTVLLDGGVSGPVSLRPVGRLVPHGEDWVVSIEDRAERIWVRGGSILLISGKRQVPSGRDKRAGFA
ncbi:MAG: hypothetical protein JW797_12415 [Bradymonadales bacterium]|nr:hypothetical protein [Bradymonadales bacterium]